MRFSFGRMAQRQLPEPVRVQVRRQRRLIWLEKWTKIVVGHLSIVFS